MLRYPALSGPFSLILCPFPCPSPPHPVPTARPAPCPSGSADLCSLLRQMTCSCPRTWTGPRWMRLTEKWSISRGEWGPWGAECCLGRARGWC